MKQWWHYVRSGFEIGISWYWSPARSAGLFLEPRGMDIFEQAASSGGGVIVLCPHIAAWELLGQSVHEQITGALYKPGGHPEIEAKIIRNRERFGMQLAPANRQGLKIIYGFLQDNKAVIILPDQEPRQGAGVFAPFFDVPALTGVLATRMLRKTKARAVFAGCMRCPDGKYRVHFQAADEGIYSDDNEVAAAAVNRGVERMIALDPPQYLWAYKRFRARPGDEPRFY